MFSITMDIQKWKKRKKKSFFSPLDYPFLGPEFMHKGRKAKSIREEKYNKSFVWPSERF